MKLYPILIGYLLVCATGITAAHPGQYDRLDRVNHRIQQQPSSQQLYLERGRIYAELERFDEAMADFTLAETLGYKDLVALDIARLCQQQGDLDCARSQADRFVGAYPNRAAGYETRARIAREAGDYPLALADMQRYLALVPSPTPGHFIATANLYEQLGDFAGALQVLDQGVSRLGSSAQLQRRAIGIELQQGETERAVQRWDSCRDTLRNSVSWKVEMAQLLILDQQRGRAGELLVQAEAELRGLKPTPARLETGEEIRRLQAQLQAGDG